MSKFSTGDIILIPANEPLADNSSYWLVKHAILKIVGIVGVNYECEVLNEFESNYHTPYVKKGNTIRFRTTSIDTIAIKYNENSLIEVLYV